MRIHNETGRSLIEMLAVVSVMGVLVVGAMSALRFGTVSMQVSSVYDQIENVAAGVSDLYSWNRSYPTAEQAAAMGQRIVKSGDVCEGCVATSEGAEVELPWGLDGDKMMIIRPGDAEHFEIALPDVPKEVCLRLKSMSWNYAEWHSPILDGEPNCQHYTIVKKIPYVKDIVFYVR